MKSKSEQHMRKGIIKKVEIIHNPCYHPDMTTVYVLVNIFVNFFLPFVSSPHYFVTHLHAYWQYPLINVASSDVSPSVTQMSYKLLKVNTISKPVSGEPSLPSFLFTLPLISVPIVEAICWLMHCTSYINLGCWVKFMYFLPHKSFNTGNSRAVQRNHPDSKFLFPTPEDPESLGLPESISGICIVSQNTPTPR